MKHLNRRSMFTALAVTLLLGSSLTAASAPAENIENTFNENAPSTIDTPETYPTIENINFQTYTIDRTANTNGATIDIPTAILNGETATYFSITGLTMRDDFTASIGNRTAYFTGNNLMRDNTAENSDFQYTPGAVITSRVLTHVANILDDSPGARSVVEMINGEYVWSHEEREFPGNWLAKREIVHFLAEMPSYEQTHNFVVTRVDGNRVSVKRLRPDDTIDPNGIEISFYNRNPARRLTDTQTIGRHIDPATLA